MAQCITCRNFYPPTFTEPVDESGEQAKCIFCSRDKNNLAIFDSESNSTVEVNKWQVIHEYQQFLNTLANDNEKVNQVILGKKPSGGNIIT